METRVANTQTAPNTPRVIVTPETETDALAWHSDQLKRLRREGEFTERVMVTPAMAEVFLTFNANNRPVRSQSVLRLADDLRNHRWKYNGETVKVDNQGQLIDGQHRMHAILHSGIAADMLMVWGVERAARMTMDTGSVRTVGDFIIMRGEATGVAAGVAASVVNRLIKWERGNAASINSANTPTKVEQTDYYYKHQREINEAVQATSTRMLAFLGGPGQRAFMFAACARANRQKARDFFDLLTGTSTGQPLGPDHPVNVLRTRFLLDKELAQLPNARIELCFRAFNAFMRGERPKKLQIMGEWPVLVSKARDRVTEVDEA